MPIWLRKLRRTLSWHRRFVAAGCAALAVLALAAALRPPDPPATAVVVTTANLPGGNKLTAEDLRVVRWPVGLAPTSSLSDPADLVGRTLSAPLSAGSPVTAVSVLSERSTELSPGNVIAPVRIEDPDLVALLRPGDEVDILGVGPEGRVATIAAGARLVAVPHAESGGGLMPSSSSATLVLVEVSSATALVLTEAAAAGPLAVILR